MIPGTSDISGQGRGDPRQSSPQHYQPRPGPLLIDVKPPIFAIGHRLCMLDRQNELLGQDADNDDAIAFAREVSFLGRPDSYVPPPKTVVTRETHMSWVFMAGERVYKLKKPVRFSYLDFSTLERRAAACQAEDALNRRLAPDVYLGVIPLSQTSTGYEIAGKGSVVDWLVVMRRLDERQTLEAVLHDHKVSLAQVHRLADILSRFYSHASRVEITPESYLLSLQKAVLTDRRILFKRALDLPQGVVGRIVNVQHRFLRQRPGVLADRVHRRFIRDGHGDLRPEHIWLSPPFPIIDCLEFDARLRASDALDELAFLHLECERLGGRWVGEAIRERLSIFFGQRPSQWPISVLSDRPSHAARAFVHCAPHRPSPAYAREMAAPRADLSCARKKRRRTT
jgi:uncharacterized protein